MVNVYFVKKRIAMKSYQCCAYIFVLFIVTVRGCGETKFKGYLMQARLAMFAKQDVKIGVFGIYNNAPYQYTCPDLRLVSMFDQIQHIKKK